MCALEKVHSTLMALAVEEGSPVFLSVFTDFQEF